MGARLVMGRLKMKRCLFILISILLFAAGSFAADDFYASALDEGTTQYREGNFKEALERLEFAAFGLMDKPELMRRVQGYSALALFQLSRFDAARSELEKLADPPEKLTLQDTGIAAADKNMFQVMLRTLFPGDKADVSTGTRRAFELVFQEGLQAADRQEWEKVEKTTDKLSNLIPDDPRISMLRGEYLFHVERFGDAGKELQSARERIQPEFHDRLLFTLVRNCERVGRYGMLKDAYKAIKDEGLRRSLNPVIQAVNERRQRDVNALAMNFTRSGMRSLADQFSGDNTLALEIWTAARNQNRLDAAGLESLAFELIRYATATDREFVLQASAWLQSVNKQRQALKLMRKTRFSEQYSIANVELLHQLAVLEANLGDSGLARSRLQRVLKLVPGLEAARNLLESMEKKPKQ